MPYVWHVSEEGVAQTGSAAQRLPPAATPRSRKGLGSAGPLAKDPPMSIVVRYAPVNLTKEKYDAVNQKLEDAGVDWPPDGLVMHVCFGDDGDLKVSEIWDSREQMEAFGEKLMPVLSEIGIEFSGEPQVFEAHNLETR